MHRLMAGMGLALTATLQTGCSVSTQQEQEMGAQYAQQINAQLPIVQDPEVNRYLNVLGDSIARLADSRGIPYQFFMVNSNEVNAFAVPGGYVYVNRGLVERTQAMDQLAGVLGHEIGHVVRRHSVKQMEKMQGANVGVTLGCILTSVCNSQVGQTAINVAGTAVFAKFSRNDEAEADQEAIKNTVRAGISPMGIPQMFQILINERKRSPSTVEAWFATHPTEEDRVAATEATIRQIDPAILRRLTVDTRSFETFKSRVHALPPAPQQRSQ